MTVSRISPGLQRALALAILAALVAAAIGLVVVPVLAAYSDARASIERQHDILEHARAAGLDPDALRAELARLKQRPRSPVGLIESANESLAAAALQERLKSTIAAAHGELRSTQTLPSHLEGQYRRVAVRGQTTVKLAGLQRVLYDLESATPLLFLDNVEVRTVPDQSARGGVVENPNLDVRFDLYGYMRASP